MLLNIKFNITVKYRTEEIKLETKEINRINKNGIN
jgi:hypothetical protein